MKLFGKKTLALILALSMVMSVCVFAEGETPPDPGAGGETPPPPATVAVESVSLDKSSHTMKVGDTVALTATVAPAEATDKTVTWESSAPAVATVSDGTVTAVALKSGEPTEVKIPYGVAFSTS